MQKIKFSIVDQSKVEDEVQRHLSTRWKHKTSQDKIKDRNCKFEGIKSLFRCKRDIINFHSHLRMVINVSKRTEDTREKRYSIDKTFIIKKKLPHSKFLFGDFETLPAKNL